MSSWIEETTLNLISYILCIIGRVQNLNDPHNFKKPYYRTKHISNHDTLYIEKNLIAEWILVLLNNLCITWSLFNLHVLNRLKTPPATPLFPSLEMEPSPNLVTQRELPITHSISRVCLWTIYNDGWRIISWIGYFDLDLEILERCLYMCGPIEKCCVVCVGPYQMTHTNHTTLLSWSTYIHVHNITILSRIRCKIAWEMND